MTIVTRPVNSNNTIDSGVCTLGRTAEVWDVANYDSSLAGRHCARPLVRSYRTPGRNPGEHLVASDTSAQRFELAQERRDNLLVGIMMTAALAVGSIFGGVFNAEEPTSVGPAQSARIAADV